MTRAEAKCAECGAQFTSARRSDAVYCSPRCRQRRHRSIRDKPRPTLGAPSSRMRALLVQAARAGGVLCPQAEGCCDGIAMRCASRHGGGGCGTTWYVTARALVRRGLATLAGPRLAAAGERRVCTPLAPEVPS